MQNTPQYQKLKQCLASVRARTDFVPEIAIVLGSGLGNYGEEIETVCEIDYSAIPGFPVSTVAGHSGKFLFGTVGGRKVVCMKGRVHFYEGYEVSDVVLPIRLMGLLGARTLLLTNAAGGLHAEWEPGSLMLIRDHISVFAPNPLIGPNLEELGVRFPDMTDVYARRLQEVIRSKAAELGIEIREGVYAQLTGPSYETPAEIQMLARLGADAVGMSTAIEAIAARHAGMDLAGISLISNQAAGISPHPLGHSEVQRAADEAAPRFTRLVTECVKAF